MQQERELLAKHIFPQLHQLCEARGGSFVDIDLRWGITEEQKAEGMVLPICLEEIQKPQTIFIGMLGDRYGWLPNPMPGDLLQHQGWLSEHFGKSVTELEILHGVLNHPPKAIKAFFYFRSKVYSLSFPIAEHANLIETAPEQIDKLNRLKDRIRLSGFPVRENYSNPEALAQLVLADITGVINQYFSRSGVSGLDRDRAQHMAFAHQRSIYYFPREREWSALSKAVACLPKGCGVVIAGETGIGKTSLLSNWALARFDESQHKFLFIHFVGVSPQSTDCTAMVLRLIGDIKTHFAIERELPANTNSLREDLTNWLSMAAVKGGGTFILDGLDQMEDREGALDLTWLPQVIPDGIRFILSASPGRTLDELVRRNWIVLLLDNLVGPEKMAFTQTYLKHFGKTLPKS